MLPSGLPTDADRSSRSGHPGLPRAQRTVCTSTSRPTRITIKAIEVDRLIALGAHRIDIGQGDVPWVVLADPDGNEFCVLSPR